ETHWGHARRGPNESYVRPAQCASGSGRTWMCTARGFEPLPPSFSHGVRSPFVLHSPRPFQPALGSSMRPSKPLAKKLSGYGIRRKIILPSLRGGKAAFGFGGRVGAFSPWPPRFVWSPPGVVVGFAAPVPNPSKAGPGYL